VQLTSASRRKVAHNLWTKRFPKIFSRRMERPFSHLASDTPFLAQMDNFAAWRSDRLEQCKAAI
jgi:hypothetical protein